VIARGDIRWFRFGTPDKRRPVLVLGRPDILPSLSQVPVIPLSTQARSLAWEVALTEADDAQAGATPTGLRCFSTGRRAGRRRLSSARRMSWTWRSAWCDWIGSVRTL
jgi:mRNA-degrading endonuclease toxin of MazEF toxin-antitoxin module